MSRFTGISFGQAIHGHNVKIVANARDKYKHASRILDMPSMFEFSNKSLSSLRQQQQEAQKILLPYDKQDCGLTNNAFFRVHRYALNGSEVDREVMLWLPRIFRKEAMLPKLYEILSEHLSQDEFVEDIVFL